MRSISLSSLAALLALAIAGCAGTGASPTTSVPAGSAGSVTTQDANATVASATPAPSKPAPNYGRQAERAVRAYYRLIDDSDFLTAWARLTPTVQAALGGYSKWKGGFGASISTRVLSATALDASRSEAEVEVRLKSVDVDACASNVTQHFKGVWALQRTSGRWLATRIVMRKTSGATPVSDTSQCPGVTGDSGDVCDPTSTAYDEASCNGGGTDDGSFCDTHQCIDSFDNGTGYIVQCNDGEWSHSGGRPGACSYHGGESDVTAP